MKRLGMLLVLVSLGLFTVGCAETQQPAAPADDAAPAIEAPAEGQAPPAEEKPAEEKPAEGANQ